MHVTDDAAIIKDEVGSYLECLLSNTRGCRIGSACWRRMAKTGRSSDARNTSHLSLPTYSFLPIPSYLLLPICPFSSIPSYLSLPICPFSSIPSHFSLLFCIFPSVLLFGTFLTPSSHLSLFICPFPSVPSHLRFCTFPTVPSHLSLSFVPFYQVLFYKIRPPNHLSLTVLQISNYSPIIVSVLLFKKKYIVVFSNRNHKFLSINCIPKNSNIMSRHFSSW